jgi:hypothetical protein
LQKPVANGGRYWAAQEWAVAVLVRAIGKATFRRLTLSVVNVRVLLRLARQAYRPCQISIVPICRAFVILRSTMRKLKFPANCEVFVVIRR